MELLVVIALLLCLPPATPATPFSQWDLGGSSLFSYTSTLLFDEPNRQLEKAKDVGFQVQASLQVDALWQSPQDSNDKLLQITIKKPVLQIKSRKAPSPDGFVSHTSELETLRNKPFLVQWHNGELKKFFVDAEENLSLVNLKRAVASLFQFRTFDTETKEKDVSGSCQIKYSTSDGISIQKTKSACARKSGAQLIVHPDKVFGLEVEGTRTSNYQLKSDGSAVESISTSEYHQMVVSLRKEAGGSVRATQKLDLIETSNSAKPIKADSVDAAAKQIDANLVAKDISLEDEGTSCPDDCPTFIKVIRDNKESLQTSNLGSIKSAFAFIKAVKIARNSKKEELVKVMTHAKHIDILPQLLDVLAAAQTADSHQAAVQVLDFSSDSEIDLPERYLWSLSFGSQPRESVIRDLMKRADEPVGSAKLAETLLLTVAGMTGKWTKAGGKGPLEKEVSDWLVKKVDTCGAEEECLLSTIRALKTLALPETLPTLVRLVKVGGKKVSVASLNAIYGMPKSAWDQKVQELCLKVFLQIGRRYDSSARTLAADLLLLAGISQQNLKEMLTSMKYFVKKECQEVGQYLLQRLRQLAERDERLQTIFKNILLESGNSLNNYHVLGQRGLATAFSREFLNTASSNGSLVSTLELAGGILKRSVLDVVIEAADHSQPIFTMGMFAGGLSSFVSTDEPPPEEEESATAGMELTVMGVQVRPFVFFEGQGELMGHVWSGTGSERTPAFQALILLHDHLESIALQNGFLAEVSLTGGMSFDLAGEVQLSLWNRNAHSVVEKNAGIGLQGLMKVETAFVKSQVEFIIATEPRLNLVTDVNFYNKVALCLQLRQPDTLVKHNVHKVERIPGSKHRLRKSRYKTYHVPGKTYALNQKNNEMCNSLFSEE